MLYIYLDFSGYSDMAIGSAKLVGIHLPENFAWPFFRRNLQQFWAHWHMSLSAWLMDYVYWPLARKGRHVEALRRKPVANSNICIVVTFVVCGLWHGESINFLIWGTYHGLGLAMLNEIGISRRVMEVTVFRCMVTPLCREQESTQPKPCLAS
jgi:alginate O-acetyltransferase complex protein AlgI